MKFFVLLTALAAVSACTIATPLSGPGYGFFSGVREAPERELVVALTYAKLAEDEAARKKFWVHARRVYGQLGDQPGFVAGSRRSEIFGDKAWTMTVWRDSTSLNAFLSREPHRSAAREGFDLTDEGRFAQFKIVASDLPLSWAWRLSGWCGTGAICMSDRG